MKTGISMKCICGFTFVCLFVCFKLLFLGLLTVWMRKLPIQLRRKLVWRLRRMLPLQTKFFSVGFNKTATKTSIWSGAFPASPKVTKEIGHLATCKKQTNKNKPTDHRVILQADEQHLTHWTKTMAQLWNPILQLWALRFTTQWKGMDYGSFPEISSYYHLYQY